MLLIRVSPHDAPDYLVLRADLDDLRDSFAGDSTIKTVHVLCDDIEHHDVMRLWEQSCAMQGAMLESRYPERS